MKPYLIVGLCILVGGFAVGQRLSGTPVNPNPGGSPFQPGHEPSLTHTATVYWTTQGDMTTEIEIRTDGHRPTQFDSWRMDGDRREGLLNSIAPECSYHVLVTSEKVDVPEGVSNTVSQGHGGLEVRVFGFKREDFDKPPVVTVSYSQDGVVVAETRVTTEPVPEKLK